MTKVMVRNENECKHTRHPVLNINNTKDNSLLRTFINQPREFINIELLCAALVVMRSA